MSQLPGACWCKQGQFQGNSQFRSLSHKSPFSVPRHKFICVLVCSVTSSVPSALLMVLGLSQPPLLVTMWHPCDALAAQWQCWHKGAMLGSDNRVWKTPLCPALWSGTICVQSFKALGKNYASVSRPDIPPLPLHRQPLDVDRETDAGILSHIFTLSILKVLYPLFPIPFLFLCSASFFLQLKIKKCICMSSSILIEQPSPNAIDKDFHLGFIWDTVLYCQCKSFCLYAHTFLKRITC